MGGNGDSCQIQQKQHETAEKHVKHVKFMTFTCLFCHFTAASCFDPTWSVLTGAGNDRKRRENDVNNCLLCTFTVLSIQCRPGMRLGAELARRCP